MTCVSTGRPVLRVLVMEHEDLVLFAKAFSQGLAMALFALVVNRKQGCFLVAVSVQAAGWEYGPLVEEPQWMKEAPWSSRATRGLS